MWLRELRAQVTHKRLPDLSGMVIGPATMRAKKDAGPLSKWIPLSGVPVTVTNLNGLRYQAMTDVEGVFTVDDLPAGIYSVDFSLPPDLTPLGEASRQSASVTIVHRDAEGAACHVGATALASGEHK